MCKCSGGLVAVTNRHLCSGDMMAQLRILGDGGVNAVVLREKDLSPGAYRDLALAAMAVLDGRKTQLILHNFPGIAKELGWPALQLPLRVAQTTPEFSEFSIRGISVHSVAEAREAKRCGATYITAGHIFKTDCKKGLPPRGLPFLKKICEAVDLPVYAIGGITPHNIQECLNAGAAGVCVMSGAMQATAREIDQLMQSTGQRPIKKDLS